MSWFKRKIEMVLPWLGGAGLAGGQALLARSCTLPKTGGCSACGSCAVVAVSLVAWAIAVRRKPENGKQITARQ